MHICIISPFLHELFTTGAASRPGWALPTAMALLAARQCLLTVCYRKSSFLPLDMENPQNKWL